MANGGLESWLQDYVAERSRTDLIAGVMTMALAACALGVAVALLAWSIGPVPEIVWLLPMALVFVFASYPFVTTKPVPGLAWLRHAHDNDPLRELAGHPFAVRYYFAEDYMFLSAIYWSPLLFHMALEEFRWGLALRGIDLRMTAAALRMAAERDSRVSWGEYVRAFPAVPLEALQRQLALVPGVVLLRNEPEGLTVTDAFRSEIRANC